MLHSNCCLFLFLFGLGSASCSGAFRSVTSGSCTSNGLTSISNKSACEAAARALGWPDTTATTNYNYPNPNVIKDRCFKKFGSLYFNSASESYYTNRRRLSCAYSDRECACCKNKDCVAPPAQTRRRRYCGPLGPGGHRRRRACATSDDTDDTIALMVGLVLGGVVIIVVIAAAVRYSQRKQFVEMQDSVGTGTVTRVNPRPGSAQLMDVQSTGGQGSGVDMKDLGSKPNIALAQVCDPPPIKDTITQLKELKELLDTGALTQGEFDAQKKKVLQSADSATATPQLPHSPPPVLPPFWEQASDESSGNLYYHNTQTGETQWERPPTE